MNVQLSDHKKNGKVVGKKKYIGGRSFYLRADEEKAKRIATALFARWQLLQLAGQGWTDEIIAECYRIGEGAPAQAPSPAVAPATAAPSTPDSSFVTAPASRSRLWPC